MTAQSDAVDVRLCVPRRPILPSSRPFVLLGTGSGPEARRARRGRPRAASGCLAGLFGFVLGKRTEGLLLFVLYYYGYQRGRIGVVVRIIFVKEDIIVIYLFVFILFTTRWRV